MRVYYTGVDNGDGSLGVEFFDCQEAIELLEEHDFERYRGEGGSWFDCYEFSEELRTMEDAKRHLIECLGISEEFING